ncbi:FAD-dependent oxidoreductase [Enterobacter chinensis]
MTRKRIVVLGAGITGVSIAWHLAHRYPVLLLLMRAGRFTSPLCTQP